MNNHTPNTVGISTISMRLQLVEIRLGRVASPPGRGSTQGARMLATIGRSRRAGDPAFPRAAIWSADRARGADPAPPPRTVKSIRATSC